MCPPVGGNKPRIIFTNVLLPQPDLPEMSNTSPGSSLNERLDNITYFVE